jgi:hypothetical protein
MLRNSALALGTYRMCRKPLTVSGYNFVTELKDRHDRKRLPTLRASELAQSRCMSTLGVRTTLWTSLRTRRGRLGGAASNKQRTAERH